MPQGSSCNNSGVVREGYVFVAKKVSHTLFFFFALGCLRTLSADSVTKFISFLTYSKKKLKKKKVKYSLNSSVF